MDIEIVEPDERWSGRFTEIAERLRAAFGPSALRIDHIGSTAVPGLRAKDVVDVQVTVGDLAGTEERLERAGLAVRRSITADHRPPHSKVSDRDLAKRFARLDTPFAANVHVRVGGAFNQRYALLCRDYLRTHPDAALAYAELKRQLARIVLGDDAYYAVKDPVFDILMAGAEAWAAAVDWEPGPTDA